MLNLRVKYSSFKYIASLNLFFLKMIAKMLWQTKLLCLFFLVQVVSAQQVPIESSCADTLGLAYDLNIISKKLGRINDTIYKKLECLEVQYYELKKDEKVNRLRVKKGALLVHETVKEDLKYIFEELFRLKFPIQSIIPINKFGLNADSSGWNDAASMLANNSSAFNYRLITLSTDLSPHAFGTAIDLNPMQNPYEKYVHDNKFLEPENAVYDISKPGTISDGQIVGIFDQRGWVWGGRWNNPVDYQHFDLRKDRGRKHYLMKESTLKMYFSQSETNGNISLFTSKNDRKLEKPTISIAQSKKKAFERCIDSLGYDCPDIWNENNFFDTLPITKNKSKNLSELHVEIRVEKKTKYENLNIQLAEIIIKKLNGAGVNAYLEGTKILKSDLSISLSIGTDEFSETDSLQIIYVPGAFKEKDMMDKNTRLDFLNLLISDDLPNSIGIAQKIQYFLIKNAGLRPVDRQIPGPNILQEECIKSDTDGIYCRNLSSFSGKHCPQLYISLLGRKAAAELFIDAEKANNFCKSSADAIFKGILEALKSN